MGFALSKRPHFHRVYLVTVCKQSSMAVRTCNEAVVVSMVVTTDRLAKSFVAVAKNIRAAESDAKTMLNQTNFSFREWTLRLKRLLYR